MSKSKETMHACGLLSSLTFSVLTVWGPKPGNGATYFLAESSHINKAMKTIPHRHAHRPTRFRPFLIETLFPGDDSSLCQIDI